MNADRLLVHYEKIADAPDAIPRLRRFILDLAVRGKLVEQDPNDEPASELLKRIAAEKAQLVKAGEIRKRKSVARIEQFEQPLALPSGWSSTRLAFVAECLDHMRKPINGTERKQRIAGRSRSELFPYFGATQQQGWIDDYIFDEELVLLGEDGVPFFDPLRAKAYSIAGKSWVNNHAHVFRGIFVSHSYLVHYLNVFDYSGRVVGATRAKLNQARALDIPITLPPLAEQHRIVAKVEELMALCDRLEEARTEREKTRDRLAAASLARLDAPDPDPAVFQNHAAFALDNLAPLTTRPDQIKALRQTILNLAVRGKLVPQNPNDEPASELMERIATEKARLVKAGKIRKQKAFPNLESNPFCVPGNWRWTRIREVTSDRGQKVPDVAFTYIDVTAIDKENGLVIGPKIMAPGEAPSRARKITQRGDVIYSCVRPYLLNVAVIEDDYDPAPIASTAFAILDGHGYVLPRYLWITLRSPFMIVCVENNQRGQAYPAINDADFSALPFPLPPLAEQHRIVAKVDELMVLCDRLEASLTTGDHTRRRLLDALLHEALAANQEEIRRDISTVALELPEEPIGPPSAERTSTGQSVN